MALADEIRGIRDRAFIDLNSAHDYYTDTQIAWDLVRKLIMSGHVLMVQNKFTGTVTTKVELAAKARGYLAEQLAEATFQQFLSIFENFFLDLLNLWLNAYPQSLSGKKVDFRSVLDAPDRDTIIQSVVRRELNEVLYDRPAGWFAYLEEKAKLGCPTTDEIEKVAEAKATRDVLIHNRGFANKTYAAKAGKLARFQDGERIDIPESYHRATWELIHKVVADVSNAAVAKVA